VPSRPAVAVFAGDHGVHAQGVTPWPQEVTAQMVANFAAGGAVVNALARQVGASVTVVDVGVAADLPDAPNLWHRKVARGTRDLAEGPAMTREQARQAVETGIEVAGELVDGGADLLVTGDMGIANTTASAALIAALTRSEPAEVTGRGTGIDEAALAHKESVIDQALARAGDRTADPVECLTALGSADLAAATGYLVAAAEAGVPVLLDGVISVACALTADRIAPGAAAWFAAGHRSTEPAQSLALDKLGLEPILDLGMRLGEGSGAVAAVPVVRSAISVLRDVALLADLMPDA